MDLAIGEVGLEKETAIRMTWGDLWRVINGYWIREDREWDRTRTIVAIIYNVNRGKKAHKKAHQLIPLPIDRMGRNKLEWTDDRRNELDKALKAWDFSKDKKGRKITDAEEIKQIL